MAKIRVEDFSVSRLFFQSIIPSFNTAKCSKLRTNVFGHGNTEISIFVIEFSSGPYSVTRTEICFHVRKIIFRPKLPSRTAVLRAVKWQRKGILFYIFFRCITRYVVNE